MRRKVCCTENYWCQLQMFKDSKRIFAFWGNCALWWRRKDTDYMTNNITDLQQQRTKHVSELIEQLHRHEFITFKLQLKRAQQNRMIYIKCRCWAAWLKSLTSEVIGSNCTTRKPLRLYWDYLIWDWLIWLFRADINPLVINQGNWKLMFGTDIHFAVNLSVKVSNNHWCINR